MEFELILIAIWLRGEYREYLKDFKEYEFKGYGHVFKAMCVTDDLVQIARLSKESVTDLMKLASEYGFSSSLFAGAYKAMRERTIRQMINELAACPKDAAQKIEKIMLEIKGVDIDSEEFIPDVANEYNAEIERRYADEKICYGLPEIDRITGGIRRNELTVIAARPGVGKTAFALQIANTVAKKNTVFFFTLEMARVQIVERLVGYFTSIESVKLKNPEDLCMMDWEAINQAYSQIPENLKIYEKTKTLESMKKLIKKHSPSVVIIDQLSHIRTRDFKTIRERYIHLTNTLKDWTTELEIPIILLTQISRQGQDRLPTLADLKESGSIEEDADNVFILHRLDKDEAEKTNTFSNIYDDLEAKKLYPATISVAKQRNGEVKRIVALYNGQKFCFQEYK